MREAKEAMEVRILICYKKIFTESGHQNGNI
jgi:hypothetical protein